MTQIMIEKSKDGIVLETSIATHIATFSLFTHHIFNLTGRKNKWKHRSNDAPKAEKAAFLTSWNASNQRNHVSILSHLSANGDEWHPAPQIALKPT